MTSVCFFLSFSLVTLVSLFFFFSSLLTDSLLLTGGSWWWILDHGSWSSNLRGGSWIVVLNLQVQVLLLSRCTGQYHTRELVILQGQSRELRLELVVA